MTNELAQWIAVGLILVIAIAWVVKRVRNRRNRRADRNCGGPCDGCSGCC